MNQPFVAWYDPNFGVRFREIMDVIESEVRPGAIRFISETSLALLGEDRLREMKDNGFVALLPGIETWFDLGNKSKTGKQGMDKVRQVADHVNMLLRYVPYVQTNFVLGLDSDQGPEPFELTKRFIDLCPGAFPGYSLLSAFGEAASLNQEFQVGGRLLPVPFHFLNNNLAMNVQPKNYSWLEFYDHIIELTRYSFSPKALLRRFTSTRHPTTKGMNLVRGMSKEGAGRLKHHRLMRDLLVNDSATRAFFEGETRELPPFFVEKVKRDLGPFWSYLPQGALTYDPDVFAPDDEPATGSWGTWGQLKNSA